MKQSTHLFRECERRQSDRLRTSHGLAYCMSATDRVGATLRQCYAVSESGDFDDLLMQLNTLR